MFKGTIRELESKDSNDVENIYDLYWSGDFREKLSKRLKEYIDRDSEVMDQGFKYFIAEEDGEVVGVAAFRKVPEHMRQYTETSNPVEFYIVAVKDKGRGIGTALRDSRLDEAKKLGYTEAVFFSGETQKDSWAFHDNSDFKRVGPAVAPNGEPGYMWRMTLE